MHTVYRVVFIGVFFPGLTFAFNEDQEVTGRIQTLAYDIAFEAEQRSTKIDELLDLCKLYPSSSRINLKNRDDARGVIMIFHFDVEFEKFRKILTHPHKDKVYKSSIFGYARDLSDQRYDAFLNSAVDKLRFNSKYKVYGKYGTQFEYSMNTQWFQHTGWIIEREGLNGMAKRIKGLAGELSVLEYFTLVARLSASQTMRIVATWNAAGGRLPIFGMISANHDDIFEGLERGHNDLKEYLR